MRTKDGQDDTFGSEEWVARNWGIALYYRDLAIRCEQMCLNKGRY